MKNLDYKTTLNLVTKCFSHIVGCTELVNMMIEGAMSLFKGGEGFSGTLIAEAGKGKSAVMIAYGKALEVIGYEVFFGTPSEFRKDGDESYAMIKNMICERGKEYALLIDEAHELYGAGSTVQLKKIGSLCMKGLDGNFNGGTIPLGDNMVATFSRLNCVVMLATNHPSRLPDALSAENGRTVRYVMPDYTTIELKTIFRRMLTRFELEVADDKAAKRIVDCARGTARPLEKITRQLSITLGSGEKARKLVKADDVTNALRSLQMFPRGLNITEIQMLKVLANAPLTDARLGQMFPNVDKAEIRKSRAYLMNCGTEVDKKGKPGIPFVSPVVGGCATTEKGKRFLADCAALGFNI